MDKQYSNLSPAKKALLEKWKAGKHQSDIIPKRQDGNNLPLSFSQQRLWFIDQLYHASSFYNIPIAFHIQGNLNITALEQSLNEILKRHEVWRTNFKLVNGEPIQVITPQLTWNLSIINLEHLSGKDWESEVKQFAAQESKKTFNLAKGLLVRATLMRLSQKEHVLLVTMHHIVTDGWSCGVFLRDLSTLYGAFSTNQPSPLPELPIQYADFAVWQRASIQGEFLATQLNYWKEQLKGELPVLQLPTDRPRPNVSTFTGAKQYFTFSTILTNALKQLSKQADATLFMSLLAAFNILLYRYTDQKDILIGSPIANRNRTELEGMLGLFVNTLVLRNNLSGNPSFRELLHRVREVTLDAYAHQDLPFEMLVEELQPERDLSRNPLYEVMFVLQNTPSSMQEVSGLTLRTLEFDSGTAQLDIFLSMSESEEGLTGYLEYNTDIFDSKTITQFINNFQTLLENIVANPEQHLSELSLLTASEQEQLLVKFNQTCIDYPQDVSLHQLFEHQVRLTPDSVALISESEEVTYYQLNHRVNQLAHYLQKQGVTKETLVTLCLERSIDMMVGILAILKAGGAYIPLDPSYPVERLNFMLSDSQASLLITKQEILEKLSLSLAKTVCLDIHKDEIARESSENPINICSSNNLAYIIYTSGSTGTPKGVLGTHRGTVNGLHWLWRTYPFSQREVCCQKTAISFVDSVWEIFAPLLRGIPTVIISNAVLLDPQLFIESLAHHKITRIILVPSLLRLVLDNYSHLVKKLSQLKFWITSGEALSVKLVQSFRELMPFAKLINLYGSSEVSANATYYDTSLLSSQAHCVPIGCPIDNTQVYVLNRDLQPTPIGVIGELYVGGDGLAKGYLHRPDLTQERFIDNPFILGSKLYKTGDLVRYLQDGHLEYLGRCDEQVKIRGFRVELGEIATVIAQHPDVQESVVIASDAQENQRLIVYVVTHKRDITTQLLSYLQQKLPNYMLPSAFIVVDALPLTPNGKIDKRALLNNQTIQSNTNKTFVAPRNYTELALVKLWENLLNTSSVGVTDNFFDLGGHSFLAVRLMAQIYDKFGHNLPLSTLFENPTIEKLAAIVSQPFRESSSSPLVAINSSGNKIPFFCIHGAGGNISPYFNLSRRLGEDYPVYALEDTLEQYKPEIISVEETAARYLQEIRKVQPNGPYLLGGHCYGGVLAFEMAQQLQNQGQTVGLLVVIDAILPEITIEPTDSDDAKFLLRIAESIKTENNIDFSVPFEELRDLPLNEQLNLINETANFIFSDAEIQDFIRYYKLFKLHVQAMRNYVPQVYPQSITLFRASEEIIHDFDNPEWSTDDPLLGWGKYSSQPIQAIDIPGDHFSIFVEPYIQELSKYLKVCIDNAVCNINM